MKETMCGEKKWLGLKKIEMVWDLNKQKVYDQRLDISFQ